MAELRVGITGATGFVGCRLAERLLLVEDHDYSVVAAVRRFSGPGLARLARLPVEFVLADLLDADGLAEAFASCDVVVHCAYGTKGTSEERRRVTVEGTRNAIHAARKAGAGRFVHFSTAVVHETGGSEVVDEETPFTSSDAPYETMKLAAEEVVWDAYQRSGLPAVVLRPTLIHGPHGRRWTERIAQEVQEGAVLPAEATVPANLVYVDNVVDATIASFHRDEAVGEGFILVDDDPPSWIEVYRAFAESMPDAPPIRVLPEAEIEAERRRIEPGFIRGSLVEPFRIAPKVIRAAVQPQSVRSGLWKIPWLAGPARMLPEQLKDRLKGEAGSNGEARERPERSAGEAAAEYPLPAPAMVDLYTSGVRFSSRKATDVLGNWQRTDFREAMERIGAWLRYQRLASTTGAGPDG